ncbi:DUF4350 domain-containing protein [Haladaptatus sp. AB618]|uniref:DUF4350 domain-containing protein n=1 Tax=Haladaptatus sp. AB618 TaxID=2934173 RepID=UPI00209BBEF5|nr:DUF4350 domain-containing protein [Haladaptatus sp. AB618]
MTRSAPFRPPTVLVLALAALVLVTVAVGSVTSTTDFGAYNPTWDGTSTLRGWIADAGGGPNVVLDSATYRTLPANRTVVFVVAPRSSKSSASLRNFVHRGGTVVVMDDRANTSNALLASLGARARSDGSVLRDERHNYHSPAMPIATNVSNGPLTRNVHRLTLNYGTAVRPHGATPLVSTSDFAYRDSNDNGTLDADESLDSYPVVTAENVSKGRVVVVGDPSVAINSMLSRPGNERFVRGLIAAHDRAVFDYTQVEGPPPFALVLIVVRRSLAAQLALVGALVLVALGIRHPETVSPAVRRLTERFGVDSEEPTHPTLDTDELVVAIEERYPSWSHERIERLVADIQAAREGGDADD